MKKDELYRELTIQALQMRREIFFGGGMDRDAFDNTYLNGIGEYERKVAKEECIDLDT